MKKVKAEFNTEGKIISLDNANVFFEGEANVLELNATFASTEEFDSIKAYIRTNSGKQIYKEVILTNNSCTLTLNETELEKGILKIGFEGQSGDSIFRFYPVTLNIDGFISDDYIIADKLYTVGITVDETVTTPPGTEAKVENVGNSKNAKLKFTLPKGTTFTPSLDNAGNLSWSNDGEAQNPQTINIRGPQGEQGEQGIQGIQGIQGEKGDKGERGDAFTYEDFTDAQLSLLKGVQSASYIICSTNCVSKSGAIVIDYSDKTALQTAFDNIEAQLAAMSKAPWRPKIIIRQAEELYGVTLNINFTCEVEFESGKENITNGGNSYIMVYADNVIIKGADVSRIFVYNKRCYIENCKADDVTLNNGECTVINNTLTGIKFPNKNSTNNYAFGNRTSYYTSSAGYVHKIPKYTFYSENLKLLNDCEVETNRELASHVKKYGAKRTKSASSPTLTRIWNAEGLTAAAGVDGNTVSNDFDSIYPWSHMRRCNISVVNDKIVINAYEGEPGYTTDGSNGHVAVEIPEFYYCPPDIEGDDYEVFGVSEFAIGGWFKSPKMYVGAYTASMNGSNALQSVSGKLNATLRTRSQFRTLAKATDSICQLIDMHYVNALQMLFTVEFATLNCQSIMFGATGLRTFESDTAQVTESNTNRIIVTNSVASNYSVGKTIEIGTAVYNYNIATDRIITSKEIYNSTCTAIYFDGDPVNITAGNVISTLPWKSGITDNIVASSGSYFSNNNYGNPCKYRGIENPWGNTTQYVDGINVKVNVPYICTNKKAYAEEVYDNGYVPLNYTMSSSGYPTEMGYDERFPFVRLSKTVGGSTNTYFCDYTRTNNTGTIMLFGGLCIDTSMCGIWNCDFFYDNKINVRGSKLDVARIMWKED